MKFIKLHFKYSITIFILLIGILGIFHTRFDFTKDKRYTLTDATKLILKKINKPLQFDIYLSGNFPAKYKYLQQETLTLLEQMQNENSNIEFNLIDPYKENLTDSLQQMGYLPKYIQQMDKSQMSNILIFPYSSAFYNGFYNKVPLLQDNPGKSEDEILNFSIENLEYTISNSINNLVSNKVKRIGFVTHHKELNPKEFYMFQQLMSDNYIIEPFFPSDSTAKGYTLKDQKNSKKLDALVVAKPRTAFSEDDKIVIDQFIMNGGKMLWMIDAVNAEMDTLYRSDKILAYPYDLNLTDLLFSYGVRINPGIVKDAKRNATLNIMVNDESKSLNWPYYVLGESDEGNKHLITKNISPVRFQFPSSIDTLQNDVKKTILYQTSSYTATMSVPNYITLDELQLGLSDSLIQVQYNKSPKFLAVLLEGKFPSAYAGRVERQEIPAFKEESIPTKMIVISDGDLAKNELGKPSKNSPEIPMEIGFDKTTNISYGNKAFMKNAMDYLLDDSGLITLRNRNVEMKLLDSQKIVNEKLKWQWINTLIPIVIVLFFGLVFTQIKRRKYSSKT